MTKLIVITGATGQQGGSVVSFLLQEPAGSFIIRAVTRNTESAAAKDLVQRGVEVVKADLTNLGEVSTAFSGAWGVFGVTQFYEYGYDLEQLHGSNIAKACVANNVKHIVWSTVEGREGECKAISWTSKAKIEDLIIATAIPYTFVYIPMYYENFWTTFFPPSYDEEKGFNWSVGFLPDTPIFAISIDDFGAWVVPAFREPEKYAGQRIKLVVEYLTLREITEQFSEVVGEKSSLAVEMSEDEFEASRYANHPAAEFMYLSWEYVRRAGPGSGVRSTEQTLSIYPQAKTYREWLKDSSLVRQTVAELKKKYESSTSSSGSGVH